MKSTEVFGKLPGPSLELASHRFEKSDTGDVTHYVNDSKRAEIAAENWQEYCAQVPEAATADKRFTGGEK